MSDKQRWPYQQAYDVAQDLVKILAPACERIVIAGSIRREKSDCGDIELLCIAQPYDHDLWSLAPLDRLLQNTPRIFSTRGGFGPRNKLMLHVPSGIPVDIFTTTSIPCDCGMRGDVPNTLGSPCPKCRGTGRYAPHWGMALMVRTGSREWNIRFMARFKQLGFAGHAYEWNGKGARHGSVSTPTGEVDCPEEADVFRLLGWKYIEPGGRI